MSAAAATENVVSYLEETLGLSFSGPRRERLLATIAAERADSGQSDEDYAAALRRPGATLDRLVDAVTVPETYFFRDRSQCELLREVVLPELAVSARTGAVAMWSAGCASGEEAFTLAALADAAGVGDRCVVVGSDASAQAIERARRGVYGRWSMRSTGRVEQAAYFEEDRGRFRVVERLRRRTRFVRRNLLDGPPPPGRFDVVLCRNLLIYLTPDAVRRAAEVLTGALAHGGWLLTAAGDPPVEVPGLEPVRTGYGLAYRRVAASAITRTPAPVVAPVPAPRRPGAPRPCDLPVPVRRADPDPGASTRATTRSPGVTGRRVADSPPADAPAQRVRRLADAGRIDEACAAAAEAVRAHPVDVELRYLAGMVLLESGRLDEAVAEAAGAVYLGPDLPAAHFLLGQVEHARGRTERARRSFRNASRLLAAASDGAPVALAGDVPAEHLAAAALYLSGPRGSR